MSERLFKNQLVAELAWVIGSVPLMNGHVPKQRFDVLDETWFHEQYNLHIDWLHELDSNPEPLEEALQTEHKLLLGKRFERLVEFWITHSSQFELLLANRQLTSSAGTHGEIDYVIKELATGRLLHLEVACKFYLGFNNSPQWSHWIGPNGKDKLRYKMDKLDRQLEIFSTEAGRQVLEENNWKKPDPVLMMKGYFFHHFKNMAKAKSPKYSTSRYPTGWFAFEKEVDQFFKGNTLWVALPKKSWLAPLNRSADERVEVWNAAEVKKKVKNLLSEFGRSVMLVQVVEQGDRLVEVNRGFVVRNSWP
jgi:hypothetical protein